MGSLSSIRTLNNVRFPVSTARYQNDPDNAAAVEKFQFSIKSGGMPYQFHTKGQWLTVLRFRRARDHVHCNILLVDSEGTTTSKHGDKQGRKNFRPSGSDDGINAVSAFDAMLFALATMQAQVFMFQWDPIFVGDPYLVAYQKNAKTTLSSLPADMQTLSSVTNVERILIIGVGESLLLCLQRKCH